jgi:hypothetical protein
MPKYQNDWTELRTQVNGIHTTYSTNRSTIISEVLQKNQAFFAVTKNVMDGQEWFYSSKMRDIHFLEHRKHFKFLATSMLPVGCGYGLATFDRLQSGPILCYKQNTEYLVGFNRDVNSTAHIDKITNGKKSPWITKKCYSEEDKKEGASVGRKRDKNGKIIENTDDRKSQGFDLWPMDWLDGRSLKSFNPKDLLGKIFLDQYLGADNKRYIQYSVRARDGKLVEHVKTKLPAPSPFNIGYLSSMKEEIIDVATINGHIQMGDGNRAKPRPTARKLFESMKRRWERLQASPNKPITYTTKHGKFRNNAGDVRFARHRHVHFGRDVERNSLKYSEVFLAPKHLDCMSANPGANKYDLSELSHLIITEGVISKASLGNTLWAVSMQYHLLKKHNHYLPIHIYDHQKGLHIALPEKNLQFLYKLWFMLPLLSQEQLDTDFYFLLEQSSEANKYSSLTTTDGVERAAQKILTLDNLKEAQSQALQSKNINNLEFIVEYIAADTLHQLNPTELDGLRNLLTKLGLNSSLQILNKKLNPTIEMDDAIKAKDFNKIELLINTFSPQLIRGYKGLDNLISFLFKEKQYTLVSLIDQKLEQWGKSRLNHKTPAQLAGAEKRWAEVLTIASHRGETRFRGEIVNGGLGDALFVAAEHSEWQVVSTLIKDHRVTHFSWHYPQGKLAGYYAIHFAIAQNQIDIVKLLVENQMDVNSHIDNGVTPLHLAMTTPGHEYIGEYLLRNGADYNLKVQGESLLDLDKPQLNVTHIEAIIKHATLPLTQTQLDKLFLKLVEQKNTPTLSLLISKYGTKLSEEVKQKANQQAKLKQFDTVLAQLWKNSVEVEEKVAPTVADDFEDMGPPDFDPPVDNPGFAPPPYAPCQAGKNDYAFYARHLETKAEDRAVPKKAAPTVVVHTQRDGPT